MSEPRTTPQPCSVCGKPSTVHCLADPFGKSDRFEWRCADHNPWLAADAVVVQQQPVSETADGLAVLRRYADMAIRFYETGYQGRREGDPEDCMVIGLVVEGDFGVGDDLFDVFRALRSGK